jgi:hypothetical protein
MGVCRFIYIYIYNQCQCQHQRFKFDPDAGEILAIQFNMTQLRNVERFLLARLSLFE